MFDLSPGKLLILAVIALLVFGPNELPKMAQRAGRVLRDLRRLAEGATADLKEGLGPEFQNFEFEDLNPRRFVQKHLLDDINEAARPVFEEFNGSAGAPAAVGTAMATSNRPALVDGAEPPFDIEAT